MKSFIRTHQTLLVTAGWLLTLLLFTLKDSALETVRESNNQLETVQIARNLEVGEIALGQELIRAGDRATGELQRVYLHLSTKGDLHSASLPPDVVEPDIGVKLTMSIDFLHWSIDSTGAFLQTTQSTSGELDNLRDIEGKLESLEKKLHRPRTVEESADTAAIMLEEAASYNKVFDLQQQVNTIIMHSAEEAREKAHRNEARLRHLTWAFYLVYFVSALLTLTAKLLGSQDDSVALEA